MVRRPPRSKPDRPEAGYPPSMIRMIVLPGMRRSGANAAGASASGRTAPTIGLSRPSLSRWARSASRERSASTTKKMARPSLGWTVGTLIGGDERAAGAHQRSRAVEDLAADHVEHHVDLAGVLQLVGLQVQEGVHSQAEGGVAVRGPAGADHYGSDLAGELHGDRTDTAGGAVDQDGLACREASVVDQRLPCASAPRSAERRPRCGRCQPEGERGCGPPPRLYSAREPLRVQSVSPNTRWPTVRPVVPYPNSTTTPDSSWPGTLGVRSRPARSTHVVDQSSSPGVNPAACTRTMTSFWAAWG